MRYTVGTKGQVVIDKEIRDALGIAPGWIASQRLAGDRVEIRFFPPEHNRSLLGILSKYVKRPVPQEDWNEVREKAWEEHVRERFGPPPKAKPLAKRRGRG